MRNLVWAALFLSTVASAQYVCPDEDIRRQVRENDEYLVPVVQMCNRRYGDPLNGGRDPNGPAPLAVHYCIEADMDAIAYILLNVTEEEQDIIPECAGDNLEVGGWVMAAACVREYLVTRAVLDTLSN